MSSIHTEGSSYPSSVFVCSSNLHGQQLTGTYSGGAPPAYGVSGSSAAEGGPPPTNEEHLYGYNEQPESFPPPVPSGYPPFYIESQGSPRSLYRGEQNIYPSHYQGNRNGPPWREMIPGISVNSSSYPCMLYPPANLAWQSNFDGGMDMRQVPMPRPPKPKRPRMSLQKRLLVNARERERMRVLNKAFESLRDALPCYIADGHMAKITTLRLAINYIKALTDLLNEQKVLSKQNGGSALCFRKEKSHEELFSNILKDTRVDGIKPVLKNLDERLAIAKVHHQHHHPILPHQMF